MGLAQVAPFSHKNSKAQIQLEVSHILNFNHKEGVFQQSLLRNNQSCLLVEIHEEAHT